MRVLYQAPIPQAIQQQRDSRRHRNATSTQLLGSREVPVDAPVFDAVGSVVFNAGDGVGDNWDDDINSHGESENEGKSDGSDDAPPPTTV